MPALGYTSLVISAFLATLCLCHAASVERFRDAASRNRHHMVRRSRAISTTTQLNNLDNLAYTVDVTIGGQSFSVQLDTGSSDLWVSGLGTQNIDISGQLNDTLVVEIVYGVGNVSGYVMFADVEFGGFTIQKQAFLLATQTNDMSVQGIMGVSFNSASVINSASQEMFGSNNNSGSDSLSNVFSQNNVSNFFDVNLGREVDIDGDSSSRLFIGSHDGSFPDIIQQPQLPPVAAGRWSVAMDGMKVNGTPFTFNQSSVSGVPQGKLAALLDTGSSLALLPPAAIDFIYSSIPGSVFVGNVSVVASSLQWLVPCTGVTNVTMTFGDLDIPVHYLDLTITQSMLLPISGKDTNVTFCFNAYQYMDLDPSRFIGLDAILGDVFMRNVYASFNFGVNTNEGPFVQLVPTTSFNTALSDFIASRAKALASLPPEISPADLVKALEQATDSPASSSSPFPTNHNGSGSLHRDGLSRSRTKGFMLLVVCILVGNALI